MKNFLVLFDRDANDDVFASFPEPVTANTRYQQLVTEIHEAETLDMTLINTYNCEGLRDIFTVAIPFDGNHTMLCEHLQKIYDDVGVAGWFQIIGTGEVSPIVIL